MQRRPSPEGNAQRLRPEAVRKSRPDHSVELGYSKTKMEAPKTKDQEVIKMERILQKMIQAGAVNLEDLVQRVGPKVGRLTNELIRHYIPGWPF